MKFRHLAAVPALALALSAAAPAAAAEKVPGIRGELIANLDDAGGKLLQLAEAMPAEKYGWRPAEGVRSVAEVFMHVGTANYTIPTFIGLKAPEGTGFDMEKQVTDKAKVIAFLKASIEHLKKQISDFKDADLEKKAKYFGMENTHRATFMLLASHEHEHLGQAIAYARMNGVVPPWSKPEPAAHK